VDPTNAELLTLSSRTAEKAYWLIYIARYYGVDLIITEGRRSIERQRQLMNRGASLTLDSRHLTGDAFDIDLHGVSPDNVPQVVWDFAGLIGELLGLRWGGRWPTLRDFRHFQS